MIKMEMEVCGGDTQKILQSLKKMTEHLIVWVKCPRCEWDVPAIDMTKHGYCYYCYTRENPIQDKNP